MAWTLDSKTQGTYQSTNPNTVNHTCAAEAKILVVCLFVNGTTARTGGSPTYNSVTMTDSGEGFVFYSVSGECGTELWYLIDPDIEGNYTVSVPNSNNVSFDISVMSFIPSFGTCVFDVANSNSNNNLFPIVGITPSRAGNLVVGTIGTGYPDVPTAGDDHTLGHTYDAGDQTFASEYDLNGAPNPVTVDFNIGGSDDWAVIGAIFEEFVTPLSINNSPGEKSIRIVTP